MFSGCQSLTSINFGSSEKLKIKDSGSFFLNMASITSLNLSNFDMSEVTDMSWMFRGCILLTSLDLSNFQTDNKKLTVSHLFWVCSNLEYVNLKNMHFNPKNDSQFIATKKNFVLCTEDELIIKEVEKYGCTVIDCSDNWRQNQKK